LDVGIVTQNGIWFRGNLYSCSLAIHEKWFERARQIGDWPLAVKYNDAEDQMHVVLENGTTVNCCQIEFSLRDSEKLMAYYLETYLPCRYSDVRAASSSRQKLFCMSKRCSSDLCYRSSYKWCLQKIYYRSCQAR